MGSLKLDKDALTLVAKKFKLLSDPVRLQILQLLQEGELSVNAISDTLEQTQPNISKHLRFLAEGDLVARRQEGNTVYYRVSDKSIFVLCKVVCSGMKEKLNDKISALTGRKISKARKSK